MVIGMNAIGERVVRRERGAYEVVPEEGISMEVATRQETGGKEDSEYTCRDGWLVGW